MAKKLHPADQADLELIPQASKFIVSLFLGAKAKADGNGTRLATTSARLRPWRRRAPKRARWPACTVGRAARKPLIYAHLADGRDVLVPADYSPNTNPASEERAMTKNTATKKTAKARTPAKATQPKKIAALATSKAPTKTLAPRARHRYDWKGAAEAAKQGKLPSEPDFSAETHRSYRPKLANVAALAKAGDVKGLSKLNCPTYDSSALAVARYRDNCVAALKAKAA
jgi:hypothetical protein